jgi:hypothetical protein
MLPRRGAVEARCHAVEVRDGAVELRRPAMAPPDDAMELRRGAEVPPRDAMVKWREAYVFSSINSRRWARRATVEWKECRP